MSTIATSVINGDITVLTVLEHGPIHPKVIDEDSEIIPVLYETRVWGGLLEGVRGTAHSVHDAQAVHQSVCDQVRAAEAAIQKRDL
jgi:hypothetical protein